MGGFSYKDIYSYPSPIGDWIRTDTMLFYEQTRFPPMVDAVFVYKPKVCFFIK